MKFLSWKTLCFESHRHFCRISQNDA